MIFIIMKLYSNITLYVNDNEFEIMTTKVIQYQNYKNYYLLLKKGIIF